MTDLRAQAREAIDAGRPQAAAALLGAAVDADPADTASARLLAEALVAMGEYAGAADLLRPVAAREPQSAELAHDLGFTVQRLGALDEAEGLYRQAIALAGPDSGVGAQATAALAELKRMTGNLDEAWELASGAFERGVREARLVVTYCRLCARRGDPMRGGAILSQMIGQLSNRAVRSEAAFELGSICDRLGRHDDAFRAYVHGNDLVPGSFDARRYCIAVDQILGNWTRPAVEAMARIAAPAPGPAPVFIVGMLRSGTSLVEQILASHPRIAGAGELHLMPSIVRAMTGGDALLTEPGLPAQADVRAAAAEQMEAMRAAAAASGESQPEVITDKTPTNYEHLGLIAAMCPGARIIHCVRHPMDTCLSIYFQRFEGRSACWSRLETIGALYRQYQRLMRHWAHVLDVPILAVQYEDLVDDLERQTRRVLRFLDVEFDEACLRFHESERVTMTASNEQVRRPIYRDSVGRWKRYEAHLDELKRALGNGRSHQ